MTATLQTDFAGRLVNPASLERMRTQLAELRSRRPALLDAIKTGFTGGDAADQAAFVEEVSRLTELDDRIADLDARIVNAVVAERPTASGRVEIGSVVTVRFVGEDETERYIVGGPELADENTTAVTPNSPMGSALLGAASGDEVSYAAPRGRLTVTVVDCG